MIGCDEFIENGQIRPPIVFSPGLNTILGDEYATNSIGKSTFLMIIDFVFGGDDYIRRSTDVHENVGVHTIKFSFEFDHLLYHFTRSTDDYQVINACDADFNITRRLTKKEYLAFLGNQFQITGLSFREAVSRFFRIHGRETLDPKFPLRNATQEPQKNGIQSLLKLFSYYDKIQHYQDNLKQAQEAQTMFKGAQKYHYLPSVNSKSEYTANEKRITALENELQSLIRESNDGLLSLEAIKGENSGAITQQLVVEKRQYLKIASELERLETNTHQKNKDLQTDLENLKSFFPTVDLGKLAAIEYFHDQLGEILNDELKNQAENLKSLLNLTSKSIFQLEQQLTTFEKIPNVAEAVLTQYSAKQNELYQLKTKNNTFDQKQELKAGVTTASDLLAAVVTEINYLAESTINGVMEELSRIVTPHRQPPALYIESHERYRFFTPNDHGTGSQYKGLICFDLAMLALSNVPVIVHDSVLLKQIEDETLEKLLAQYNNTQKQVFIVLDKKGSFSEKMQAILQATTVLKLTPASGALFGRTWNKNL